MEQERLKSVIEALLFASDSPLGVAELAELLGDVTGESVLSAVTELRRQYDDGPHSFRIVQVAGGFQFCSKEEFSEWLERLRKNRRRARLSRAALETSAIIAYRQPVTKAAIEEIRGVDSTATLHTLLERGLVTIKGRARSVGRPLLYGTTRQFLIHFGLNELEELPKLSELKEILDQSEVEETEESLQVEGDAGPEVDGGTSSQ
ncbi:MAG: SMC-Scp complex subunit ScpB [Candidatus Eiseniibacteriota bacterium]|nr:MAG: SMC-Scp complex subunit ScpB [Candidatus Eisenbacteria bacterium]